MVDGVEWDKRAEWRVVDGKNDHFCSIIAYKNIRVDAIRELRATVEKDRSPGAVCECLSDSSDRFGHRE